MLVSCPVAWSGKVLPRVPGEAEGEAGGARPVAGGEARRLPGAARTRAGQLAGGGKMRAEKRGRKGAAAVRIWIIAVGEIGSIN